MRALPKRAAELCSKARVLMELAEAGFPVPCFEVSPADLSGALRRLGAPLAVRSCASVEDGSSASFAGQFATVLDVRVLRELEDAVSTCRASRLTSTVRDYCRRNGFDAGAVRMEVIVQRMVAPRISGVAFSIDPVSGEDRVVIEACEGIGDALLAGRKEPLADDHPELVRWRPAIERLARRVQRHFGAPQDIEFAIDRDKLWLLQARPITRIAFSAAVGEWTNADFRDGGVSESVCSPLMWSLYERVWQSALIGFLKEIRLLRPGDSFEAGRMFFGRPYWNLAAVKQCLSKLPGYVERRFDDDLNVDATYPGDGVRTPVTVRTVLAAAPTAWALRRFFRRQETFDRACLEHGFETAIEPYESSGGCPLERLERLVANEFLLTEREYFRTIFAASLAKLDFKDSFPDADEAALVTGLGPLRHLAPLQHMREMLRTGSRDVDDLLHRFRHHHPAGLDIIHPRWDQQRPFVERLLANLSPEAPPSHPQEAAEYRAEFQSRLARRRRGAFARKLNRLRAFLYLREEMRDCSSRLYHIIRRDVLSIAHQRGLGNDVFFMTVEELLADDRSNIAARRDVYERFRNFQAPNEVRGGGSHVASDPVAANASTLCGLAAGRGHARGTARVVRSVDEVSRLERGMILVCPFVDPGWTCVLSGAAAVVSETGGLLSHAAVICRELGLPTVLGVRGAMRIIKDGDLLEVDGGCGEVRLLARAED